MQLRPYQREAVERSWELLTAGTSCLCVAPTGTGKAILMAALASRWVDDGRGNVLILCHFRELIQQAADKVKRWSGHAAQIEMNTQKADRSRMHGQRQIVVGSVPTMKGRRLERWPEDTFSLIISDEAHHTPAKSWNAIFKHFGQAVRWGCTATPFRKDKQRVLKGGAFDELAFEMQLPHAINQGWLVPIRQQYVRIEAIRWDRIKIDAKRDFTDEEVATVMDRDEVVRPAVDQIFSRAGSRPTIVFCATVEHAKHVSEVMNSVRPGCSSYVASYKILDDGRKVPYPPERREADIDAFKSNRKQFLVNVGVFLEGADLPNCACIAHLVGTKSLGKVMQSVGRGTRTLPPELVNAGETDEDRRRLIAGSAKPDTLVLDFVGISGQHKLIYTPAMLLPTGTPTAVRQLFKARVEKAGGAEDADRILAECREEVRQRIERIQQIRNNLSARAEVHVEDVDPFGTNHVPYTSPAPSVEGPTDAMASFCLQLVTQVARAKGVKPAFTFNEIMAMPRRKVSGLIGKFKAERDNGPPSGKQVTAIRRAGFAVPQTFADACSLLNRIKGAQQCSA